MRIHLRHPIQVVHRAEAGAILVAVAALGFWLTSGRPNNLAAMAFTAATRSADTVPAENTWQEFSVAQRLPDVMAQATLPELQFQNQNVPVAKVDGSIFNGRLPETLWVKLDQPGNAFLIVETDAGTFVKPLTDASPGYESPCRLDTHSFGTLQGGAVDFDRDTVVLKTLWIVQDAQAAIGRIPGWVQIPQGALVADRK